MGIIFVEIIKLLQFVIEYLSIGMHEYFVKPIHPQLRKYIQYFFFIEGRDESVSHTYTCFPNTNICLGLHEGISITPLGDNTFDFQAKPGFNSYLSGIYQTPMTVSYRGVFRGVWVNFEPLGIEALAPTTVSNCDFVNNAIENALPVSWSRLYDIALSNKRPDKRARGMEEFFLDSLNSINEKRFVPFNQILAPAVDNLREVFNSSYSSINRIYANNLGITPKQYLRIQRFRHSLSLLDQTTSLTDIAYNVGYADQSHMIRDFHKFANSTPLKVRKDGRRIKTQLIFKAE